MTAGDVFDQGWIGQPAGRLLGVCSTLPLVPQELQRLHCCTQAAHVSCRSPRAISRLSSSIKRGASQDRAGVPASPFEHAQVSSQPQPCDGAEPLFRYWKQCVQQVLQKEQLPQSRSEQPCSRVTYSYAALVAHAERTGSDGLEPCWCMQSANLAS